MHEAMHIMSDCLVICLQVDGQQNHHSTAACGQGGVWFGNA